MHIPSLPRFPHLARDSGLEAFSHNPTDGSFAPLAGQPRQIPIVSRRSKPSSRSLLVGEQSNALWILLHNDRKSRHRRIKKRRYERLAAQASYPCGNFSDTSLKTNWWGSKGSIGHDFTVCIRTENQNQVSFYPFVLHEISVLIELTLGHLRYYLTDVPPQPNSPPDSVYRDRLLPDYSRSEH